MSYLLDTHAVIWLVEDSPKMPTAIKGIIMNPESQISISSISLWEIAIKMNIGKINLGLSLDSLIDKLRNCDFDFLQIKDEYLLGLSKLPLLHKDPFDRLLISTALLEEMTIITIDENIHKYNVPCIW